MMGSEARPPSLGSSSGLALTGAEHRHQQSHVEEPSSRTAVGCTAGTVPSVPRDSAAARDGGGKAGGITQHSRQSRADAAEGPTPTPHVLSSHVWEWTRHPTSANNDNTATAGRAGFTAIGAPQLAARFRVWHKFSGGGCCSNSRGGNSRSDYTGHNNTTPYFTTDTVVYTRGGLIGANASALSIQRPLGAPACPHPLGGHGRRGSTENTQCGDWPAQPTPHDDQHEADRAAAHADVLTSSDIAPAQGTSHRRRERGAAAVREALHRFNDHRTTHNITTAGDSPLCQRHQLRGVAVELRQH